MRPGCLGPVCSLPPGKFEPLTCAVRLWALRQRVGDRRDAVLEIVERGAAGGGVGDIVDFLTQQLHLGGEVADGFI